MDKAAQQETFHGWLYRTLQERKMWLGDLVRKYEVYGVKLTDEGIRGWTTGRARPRPALVGYLLEDIFGLQGEELLYALRLYTAREIHDRHRL